jgi:hypothetical protein
MISEKLLYWFAGFVVTIISGLAGYIHIIEKRHRKERKEWAERDAKNFDRVNDMTDDNNKVLRENTNILSGLKTLLENQRRNDR